MLSNQYRREMNVLDKTRLIGILPPAFFGSLDPKSTGKIAFPSGSVIDDMTKGSYAEIRAVNINRLLDFPA